MAYAQDTRRRDLVIKLTDKGSMEYNIYRHLAKSGSLYDSRECAGVLPPTAVLDSPYQFAFVVMPVYAYFTQLLVAKLTCELMKVGDQSSSPKIRNSSRSHDFHPSHSVGLSYITIDG